MPNDPYSARTALLTSKLSILYIYSTNKGTEYFKHGIYSTFFSSSSSKCSLFHNSNVFDSCFIHILYTGCAKIKKKFRHQKVNYTVRIQWEFRWKRRKWQINLYLIKKNNFVLAHVVGFWLELEQKCSSQQSLGHQDCRLWGWGRGWIRTAEEKLRGIGKSQTDITQS